jgi:hypothetical protein
VANLARRVTNSQPTGTARPADAHDAATERVEPRPIVERIGLALIALVLTGVFGALAAVALTGGEVFLAVMSGTGALMTLWAAAATLRRG